MGEEKTFKCPKCANVVKLNDGLGMLWSSFDKSMFYHPKNSFDLNFYDELDKKTINEIHKFIEESKDVFVVCRVDFSQPNYLGRLKSTLSILKGE